MIKKRIGLVADILMYAILVTQMLYVFVGNNVHEILGMAFFACMIVHVVIKGWWFKTLFRKGKAASRYFFDVVTLLLMLSIILLMVSSMGVSRLLFPWFKFMGSSDFHRGLATAVLMLGVLHGGMHGYWRAGKKSVAIVLITLGCAAAAALGIFLVPYLNRHLRAVDVSYAEKVLGEQISWSGTKPVVVYFTRVGNTDFEPDVDAVSGASLLIADGEMMGSNRLLADMAGNILDVKPVAITLTGKKYPSSYNATVSVAGEELRKQVRPAIEPVDVSGADAVILIYPLWWGSIPMPVATFLEEGDFDGKTIYLIATQGSSGYGNTVSEVEALCPGAKVVPGTSIYCEDIPDAREELLDLIREWNRR